MAIYTGGIEGLDQLILSFNKLAGDGKEANSFIVAGSKEAAELIKEESKKRINNRSGDLAKSIEVKQVRARGNKKYSRTISDPIFTVGPKYVSGKSSGGVNYGHNVELGHRLVYFGKPTSKDVDEKPFLRPAADENKERVVSILVDALNRALETFKE